MSNPFGDEEVRTHDTMHFFARNVTLFINSDLRQIMLYYLFYHRYSPIGSKILIMKVVEISMMMMMSITILAAEAVKVVALEQNIFCY